MNGNPYAVGATDIRGLLGGLNALGVQRQDRRSKQEEEQKIAEMQKMQEARRAKMLDISNRFSRAKEIAGATSFASEHCTMTAGRRSIIAFHIFRVAS